MSNGMVFFLFFFFYKKRRMEQIQDCNIKDFIKSHHPYTFSLAMVCFVRVLAAIRFDRHDGL